MDRERDRRPGAGPALSGAAPRKRRSRLRPPRALRATRAGWCFIAIVFGVGFAALNTGNNLLYLVLAMMLAFLVLSGLLSESSLRGLRVERRLPSALHARTEQRVTLRLHNDQARAPAFAISVDDLIEAPEGPVAAGRCFALRIAPGGCADRQYVFAPERRGDLRFDRVRASTRFPFGLFVKSLEIELPEDALVYPEVWTTPRRPGDPAVRPQPEAVEAGPQPGDDVAGLREYAPGDGLGRVHWRRSARAGRLLVGEREGEASGALEVRLALDPGASANAHEERIAEAASEAITHLDAGLRVGLVGPGLRIPRGAGAAHRRELLTVLARLDPGTLLRTARARERRATSGTASDRPAEAPVGAGR